MIEILLWQDIKKLGKRGEVVKVADGYARNYLFPKRLASLSTQHNMRELEHEKKRFIKREEKLKLNLKQLAERIEKTSCTIEMRANEEGGLFGSVSSQMIVDALQQEEITGLDPKMIELESPIKELGVYRVIVKLHQEVAVHCRLWVVEEAGPKKGLEEEI